MVEIENEYDNSWLFVGFAKKFASRRPRKETSGIHGAIRALNLEGRLTESKYKRSPAALP